VPVGTQRSQLIADQRDEFAAGFTTRKRAISTLNPQLTMEQVEELIEEIDEERGGIEESQTEQAEESPEVENGSEMATDQG
jgi:hypothetical protein